MASITTIEQATPEINMEINQGADFELQLAYTEDDETTTVPLTGLTARMMIRLVYGAATPLCSLTSGDGLTLDESEGTIDIYIAAAVTATFPARVCVWDLELVDGAGHVSRFVQGTATVSPEATK